MKQSASRRNCSQGAARTFPPPLAGTAPTTPAGAVTFKALLKEVNIKSLVSGDKAARITFEVNKPDADNLDLLNRLHDPTKEINLGVWA